MTDPTPSTRLREAVQILAQHNDWRRGAETPQQTPGEIGAAIDVVCELVPQLIDTPQDCAVQSLMEQVGRGRLRMVPNATDDRGVPPPVHHLVGRIYGPHNLKLWPDFFQAKLDGIKPWEYRQSIDRVFMVGDVVTFFEWDPSTEKYTGRTYGPCLIKYISCVRDGHDIFTHGDQLDGDK